MEDHNRPPVVRGTAVRTESPFIGFNAGLGASLERLQGSNEA